MESLFEYMVARYHLHTLIKSKYEYQYYIFKKVEIIDECVWTFLEYLLLYSIMYFLVYSAVGICWMFTTNHGGSRSLEERNYHIHRWVTRGQLLHLKQLLLADMHIFIYPKYTQNRIFFHNTKILQSIATPQFQMLAHL